jgi:bifunctional non-homologous end joining protein LigD
MAQEALEFEHVDLAPAHCDRVRCGGAGLHAVPNCLGYCMQSMHVSKAPKFVTPMAAQPVNALPEGNGWLYELKLDGYRTLLLKDGERVQILSRNEKDLTQMYPRVVAAGHRLKAQQALVDGEIVALAEDGRTSFQALQHRSSHAKHQIVFYAFDLLHLDGDDLTSQPLFRRREKLPKVIGDDPNIRLSLDLPGSVSEIVRILREAGVEGVVAKRRASTYQSGERSGDWVKLKLEQQQELVIGGYRPDGSIGLDALLMGFHGGRTLLFAGNVRAGFTLHIRRELVQKLKPLAIASCHFANLPDATGGRWGGVTAEDMREMCWTRPQLVAQIRFTEWTADSRLRHASFIGVRTDKTARVVRRE